MKAIKDHDGYFVDEDGRVFCNLGKGNRRNGKTIEPYELTPRPTKNGYLRICARNSATGKRDDLYVHRLVSESFIANPDNLPEVNHKRGNKADNRVSELEWSTRPDNLQHAIDTGLRKQKGADNWMASLTWDQVREIREQYRPRDTEYGGRALAERYGVTPSTICNVLKNKTWKDGYRGPTHRTKLCPEEIADIRDSYIPKDPQYGGEALAKKFGVSKGTISRIVNGR
jgi:hypothetical protein